MLAASNGPVLDAQRTFNYQTATVLRGAYFQPLSRALTRPHALARTVAKLRRLVRQAAQELKAQAAKSAHSAIGPYQECSVRRRAVKMIMTNAASLRAIKASFIELPRA
jgi:hypothetical protein